MPGPQADARAPTGSRCSAAPAFASSIAADIVSAPALRRTLPRLAPLALALAFTLPAQAQDKWGPHIDFEAKPGNKRSLGEGDLFLPFAQDSRTLWFANIRTRFDNHDGYEGNLGLGVRRMLEGGWNLGAYAYADRRRSQLGNTFDQATFGLEALGRDFEARGNVYAPVGSRAKDIGTVSTASLSGASVQVSTDFREERALKGYDAEAGWRVPFWDAEAQRQFRVYLGGFRFADAGISVSGPRARAEFVVQDLPWFDGRSSLFIGAETQHDSMRGTNNFAYVRLRIPLGGGAGSAAPRLNAQERRMTAPVVRDIDIVTQSRTRATLNETASTTANGQTLTVLNSTTTTGAALPGAITAAGANSTVVLTGTFNTTASTVLQTGQTLMGAGSLAVRTPSGYVATISAPGATINGTNVPLGDGSVVVADNSTVRGMTINDFSSSVSFNSVGIASPTGGVATTGVSLIGNTITARNTGSRGAQAVLLINATNATISGNTITVNSGGSNNVGIQLADTTGNTSGMISNNTVSVTNGVSNNYAVWLNGGTVTVFSGSTGNNVIAGTCRFDGLVNGSVGFTNGGTCP